jgi:hypothetical protein
MDGSGTTVAAALAVRIARAAVERDGPTALVCTKRSTALHEAGHCVISAVDGTLPTNARIWPIVYDGRIEWLGRTEGIPGGCVDGHSPVPADIVIVRSLLAGVVAERLLDSDARRGSSTDEIASAIGVVKEIAHKTGRLPTEVWLDVERDVELQLWQHRKVVRAIADKLMCTWCIKSCRLKKLLRPIWGT